MIKNKKLNCLIAFTLTISLVTFFSSQIVHSENQNKITKRNKENKKDDDKKEEKVKKEPINENEFEPILIGILLNKPSDFLEKKIKFRGKFSSFTTLALDYKPAMRSSKEHISLCLFRPDSNIPLSELKLAYEVKEAKEDPVIKELEEGDLLEIYGKVFSAALDEPWVDILSIKKIQSAKPKDLDTSTTEEVKKEDKNTNSKKKK